jgi:hypothetical protein
MLTPEQADFSRIRQVRVGLVRCRERRAYSARTPVTATNKLMKR